MTLQSGRYIGVEVPGIAPCDGWALKAYPEDDCDSFTTTGYVVVRDDVVVLLRHSRFDFTPTQARFDWLVRNDFPSAPGGGPWTNAKIDGAIAGLRIAA